MARPLVSILYVIQIHWKLLNKKGSKCECLCEKLRIANDRIWRVEEEESRRILKSEQHDKWW